MKKLFGVLMLSSSFQAICQSLTPTVVASTGDYYTGSAATLSWTLGEVVTDTYIGSNNQLTQGFQQPQISFATLEDLAIEMELSLFPNPTTSVVNLEVKNNTEILAVVIFDLNGQVVYSDYYQPATIKKIDLNEFSSGVYLMQISNQKSEKLKSIKIQKS